MATTTNFGWETPDDTDLVKDGALAIRTLGSAIDTSLVDLKGGTTGQVLSKTSNTDMDFTWVTSDDANAIQNAIVDAKGDLITATAADTPARLAVGTNGQVLTADSTTATGLKWAAASSSAFVGCDLRKTANQSITSGGAVLVTWDSENFDTNGFHDNTTNNSRITIPSGQGGYYLFYHLIRWGSSSSGQRNSIFYLNGVEGPSLFRNIMGGSTNQIYTVTWLLNLAAGDYVQVYANQDSGSSLDLEVGSVGQTTSAVRFGCVRLG